MVRSNVRKSLRDILVNRCKDDQMAINLEALGRICIKIEAELLKLFGETGHKYKTKYRSLIFNLKDTQNKVRVFGYSLFDTCSETYLGPSMYDRVFFFGKIR